MIGGFLWTSFFSHLTKIKGKVSHIHFLAFKQVLQNPNSYHGLFSVFALKALLTWLQLLLRAVMPPFILLELLFSHEGDYIVGIKEINAFPKEPQVPLVYSHVNTSALEKVTTKYLVVLIEWLNSVLKEYYWKNSCKN